MMNLLAINWSVVGLQASQLILSLSILVILHELGHYIPAKIFKCRVEKFYLFFDPWFALFRKKVGETEYGVGWLPLGGYVKISGMVDESLDKNQMKEAPKPYEFRSKPPWQRLIIMIGGVTMNVLLAFLIYAMIMFVWGERKVPVDSMKHGLVFQDKIMNDFGFRNGDRILSVDGRQIDDYHDIVKRIIVGDEVTIEREGKIQTIALPKALIGMLVERKKNRTPLVEPRLPSLLAFVPDTLNAYKSGLRNNDQIIAVNSTPIQYFDQLQRTISSSKNQTVNISVLRGSDTLRFATPVTKEGTIGAGPFQTTQQLDSLGWLEAKVINYSFFESFPAGVRKAGDQLEFYIQQFIKIFTPGTGAIKGIGGFGAMAQIFPSYGWDWESFWNITAFLSIILAFMNILPIPALDGGHVVFTLVEMITGRKPSDKFLEYAQIVGMVLLLALLLYANLNDIIGYGRNR